MRSILKWAGIGITAALLIGLMAADIGLTIFFKDHFLWGTMINGQKVGGLTMNEAKEKLLSQKKDFVLQLDERMGKKEMIKGEDIDFHYELKDKLEVFKDKQPCLQWPTMKWQDKKFETEIVSVYDEDKLEEKLKQLDCMDETKAIQPEEVQLSYIDGSYQLVPGTTGTQVDEKLLKEKLIEAVKEEETSFDLEDEKCYKVESIDQEPAALTSLKQQLEKYMSSEMTYDFGDRQEKVSGKQIRKWLRIKQGNGEGVGQKVEEIPVFLEQQAKQARIVVDEEAVRKYVDELADKYDTFQNTRSFKTSGGKVVQVPRGDYGWRIDREEEVKTLIKLITSGNQKLIRQPAYLQEGYCRAANDIGDSYVEVSLTRQHLWFYVDGSLVVQGDIVSGTGTNSHATPPGVYNIDYKQANAVLRGPDYVCPVSYWMPFYNGMGIHDATWRGSFGGTIYRYSGSHGCINAPLNLAKAIFEKMEKGMPVVCYNE